MTDHSSKQFDAELEAIRTKVLLMGGLVEQQISNAIDGLASGNLAALDEVIENDHQVNRMEVELDEACSVVLARRQPAAGDLRMLITVIKSITDLERMGDEAEKIARMARAIHEAGGLYAPKIELAHMATVTVSMLRHSLDGFARLDAQAAAHVVRQDQAVDDEFRSVLRQLITFMMEDPRTISRSLDLMFIAKAIERIGDHAKNMSEYVVYMVKGRDVRHISVDKLERAALSA